MHTSQRNKLLTTPCVCCTSPVEPFLRQLFHQIASPNLEENVTYILDDVANLLANVPTELLRTAFVFQPTLRIRSSTSTKPFLAEYDPQRRIDRGVYYTPPQVISYIVRSVDALLKNSTAQTDGLAENDVLILDPATGTGRLPFSSVELHQRVHHNHSRYRRMESLH